MLEMYFCALLNLKTFWCSFLLCFITTWLSQLVVYGVFCISVNDQHTWGKVTVQCSALSTWGQQKAAGYKHGRTTLISKYVFDGVSKIMGSVNDSCHKISSYVFLEWLTVIWVTFCLSLPNMEPGKFWNNTAWTLLPPSVQQAKLQLEQTETLERKKRKKECLHELFKMTFLSPDVCTY